MREATVRDKQLVTEILVSAFLLLTDDNSINYVIKEDGKRAERMQILMEYLFEKAILSGAVYISDNNKACILLLYPHKEKITFKAILLNLRLAFKCISIERVFTVLKRQRLARKYYPKEKHIRPLIMGVTEEFKGSGLGASLAIEVMKSFEDNQLPVITNAASERNVQLYEKFGFKRISKDDTLGFPIHFLRLN